MKDTKILIIALIIVSAFLVFSSGMNCYQAKEIRQKNSEQVLTGVKYNLNTLEAEKIFVDAPAKTDTDEDIKPTIPTQPDYENKPENINNPYKPYAEWKKDYYGEADSFGYQPYFWYYDLESGPPWECYVDGRQIELDNIKTRGWITENIDRITVLNYDVYSEGVPQDIRANLLNDYRFLSKETSSGITCSWVYFLDKQNMRIIVLYFHDGDMADNFLTQFTLSGGAR